MSNPLFLFSMEHALEFRKPTCLEQAFDAARRLAEDANDRAAFLTVASAKVDLENILRVASSIEERFRRVLVLGIGGSGLGTLAALSALAPIAKGGREVRVLSNVDPVSVAEALAWFDPRNTLLNVVTKSGTTVETLAQFAVFADSIRKALGDAGLREGVVFTTDPERGAARRMAIKLGTRTIDVPPKVGGRYSVLTGVGLFPLMLAGHDVAAVLRGADRVIKEFLSGPNSDHPSIMSAAFHYDTIRAGLTTRVIWAYCDRLIGLCDWFCQLWAESLGKSRNGEPVGQTPLRAIGSTDQHSLLQLFMDGPRDKCYTFVTVSSPVPTIRVPDFSELDMELSEFAGRELIEVLDALRRGTMAAMIQAGRPLLHIHIPKLDEEALGALFAHFEIETAVLGYMLGIDPFDQPGVEAGKRFAHGLLGRPKMERYREEAERLLSSK